MSASVDYLASRVRFEEAQAKHFISKLVFCCESAKASVCRESQFVYSVEYSGVLSRSCFAELRAKVIDATQEARVLTLHVEKALMAENAAPAIPLDTYRLNMAPAAVIVRPDQFDVFTDYAEKMADLGITRVVFLYSQQMESRLFVDCLSGAQVLTRHQSQPSFA